MAKPGIITNWDLMEQQVLFYREHLDIFIEDQFKPIRLTNTQRVIAREFGRCSDLKICCSRGYGKTFIISLCAFAWCCLYPGTKVAVASATATQAALTLKSIKDLVDNNPNMQKELTPNGARTLVQYARDKGTCRFKNGSEISSYPLSSMRGHRATIVIIDECLMVCQDDIDAIASPLTNAKRFNVRTYGVYNMPSKNVAITSACDKANDFYGEFCRVVRNVAKGDMESFALALSYEAAVHDNISDRAFFERERQKMPEPIWLAEYETVFVGGASNSVFPYAMVDACRNLETIELHQPKNSKSRYIMSVDIATSEADDADNTIVSVIKFAERSDGTYHKKLVYIRSYHGMSLDKLSQEIRVLFHTKFPNVERIVYDRRGVGDSFDKFFVDAWTDPESGKEYPPLCTDDQKVIIRNARPILHPVQAVVQLNQRIATNFRVALEKRTISFPINSRLFYEKALENPEKKPTLEEKAVYEETDALQFECGNIVCKITSAGNATYDTATTKGHKDRYSSVSYGVDYIAQLEAENIKRFNRGTVCIGFATAF